MSKWYQLSAVCFCSNRKQISIRFLSCFVSDRTMTYDSSCFGTYVVSDPGQRYCPNALNLVCFWSRKLCMITWLRFCLCFWSRHRYFRLVPILRCFWNQKIWFPNALDSSWVSGPKKKLHVQIVSTPCVFLIKQTRKKCPNGILKFLCFWSKMNLIFKWIRCFFCVSDPKQEFSSNGLIFCFLIQHALHVRMI